MNNEITVRDVVGSFSEEEITVEGSDKAFFTGVASLGKAGAGDLCFCKEWNKENEKLIADSKAAVIICPLGAGISNTDAGRTFLLVKNPRLLFAKILAKFFSAARKFEIHATAIVGKDCELKNVSIAPYAVIGDNVQIGEGSVILSHAVIADNVKIGRNARIKSHAVIGQKGFGFEFDENNVPFALLHLGGVVIGDDVEIGSHTIICRGVLDDTFVSDYVKMDDNVFIAHNVKIGARTILTACAQISGSATIGVDCWLGPNCSVINKAVIGDNVLVGIGSNVTRSVPDNVVVVGNPARILRKNEPRK